MANRLQDLTGMRFSRLLVTGGRTADAKGNASWDCVCDCGTKLKVTMHSLKRGHNKSCGCLRSELASMRGRKSKTHGLSLTDEYSILHLMKDRCRNPESSGYANYGARGIDVCPEWDSVENFMADMGPRPSPRHQIDRIDNNVGYSKANCRWATPKENMRNTRANALVELGGVKITIAEAAELTGLNYTTIHFRHNKGMTEAAGLFKPVSR